MLLKNTMVVRDDEEYDIMVSDCTALNSYYKLYKFCLMNYIGDTIPW